MASKEGPWHVVCVCGQKMRVTRSMAEAPARCVSCRQRLRIPPADVLRRGSPVDLAAHPQFLRATVVLPPRQGEPQLEKDEAPPIDAPHADTRMAWIPLKVLKPLQRLVSLEERLARRKALRPEDPRLDGHSPATLREQRQAVRKARAKLDERLRRLLLRTASALKEVQAAIEGLCPTGGAAESAGRALARLENLRARRDAFETHRTNILGWLCVRTPEEAGGYVRVELDWAVSEDCDIDLPLPEEAKDRLTAARESLKAALAGSGLHEKAAEAHWRGLLKRMAREWTADAVALEGELGKRAAAPGEFALNDDDRRQTEQLEALAQELRGRARLADQAAAYRRMPKAVGESGQSEVLRRAKPRIACQRPMAMTRAMMSAAAVLLIVSLFLPVFGRTSPVILLAQGGSAQPHPWVWLGSILVGAVLCVARTMGAAWPEQRWSLAALFAALVCAAVSFHEARYAAGGVGAAARSGFGVPAGLLLAAAGALLAVGGLAAHSTMRGRGRFAILQVVIPAAAVLLIATNALGLGRPSAGVTGYSALAPQGPEAKGAATIELKNTGLRRLHMAAGPGHPAALRPILVARSSQEVFEPDWAMPDVVLPGEAAEAAFENVAPGEYELQILGRTAKQLTVPPFVAAPSRDAAPAPLPELMDPAPPEEAPSLAPQDSPEEASPAPQDLPAEQLAAAEGPIVQLRGRIAPEDRDPYFTISVRMRETPDTLVQAGIGDTVIGGWFLREHSPSQETVTLSNGEDLAILRAGNPVTLPPIVDLGGEEGATDLR